VTGGSLPVEIWSAFMRTAHEGVPVVNLPMYNEPGLYSGPFGRSPPVATKGAAPLPPALVQTSAAPERGIDGWFLDSLFGRR